MEREQIFLIERMNGNFNLRSVKDVKITNIYFVVNINRKQVKIPTGIKVKPTHWNPKKQKALISASLTELDNYNNLIANTEIERIRLRFVELKQYLCNHLNEITNVKLLLNQYCGKMKKTKDEKSLIILLRIMLEESTMKESSRTKYYSEINSFERFIKERNRKGKKGENNIIITAEEINTDLLLKYNEYLKGLTVKDKYNKEKLVPLELNTINAKMKKICYLLGRYGKRIKFDFGLEAIKGEYGRRDRVENNQVILYIEEIKKLEALELPGKKKDVRDLFIFQFETGQRFSDINGIEIDKTEYEKNKYIIEIVQEKTGKTVPIMLTEKVRELVNKYDFKLPKINNQVANKILRELGQEAGIDRRSKGAVRRNSEQLTHNKAVAELLTTHCARRSFISYLSSLNINEETIKKITGHSSNSAYSRYDRRTSEDAAKTILKRIEEEKGMTEEDIKTKDEAKQVLSYLGVDSRKFQDINNTTILVEMIGRYEGRILDEIGDENRGKIKELFNEKLGLLERSENLHRLIDVLKNKK